MKTKKLLSGILFAAGLLAFGSASAEQDLPNDVSRALHQSDQRRLPPYEQVRLNAKRVEADPNLRNKWDSKAHRPASVMNLRVDNLPQGILSKLGSDEDLADRAMKIKVSSQNGTVVLEGVVNDEAERGLVVRKVARMEGVKEVDDRLKIKTSNADLE